MYTTRPLSQLLKSPEILAAPPSSDGPNSGYLIIQDEDSETHTCFGCCKKRSLKHLPFPQNKELRIQYVSYNVDTVDVSEHPVLLIPLLNQPLSTNRYYAIVPHGKHKGKAYTCSREENKTSCCFFRCVKDVKATPFDPDNIYQQIEIGPNKAFWATRGSFVATSTASDGFPPYILRREGWTINTKTPKYFKLDTAEGIDSKLRARLPGFDFPVSEKSSEPLVVGKWYSPFMFVEEGTLRDRVKRAMYYEVTLEQRWERVFGCSNSNSNSNSGDEGRVVVDVVVENEQVFVGGSRGEWDERRAVNGVILFKGKGTSVGLRVEVVERMKWEQERFGWVREEGRRVKVKRVEKVHKGGRWREFGCYALVERFNLRRMDGSLVMCYDFNHFHHLRTKWE